MIETFTAELFFHESEFIVWHVATTLSRKKHKRNVDNHVNRGEELCVLGLKVDWGLLFLLFQSYQVFSAQPTFIFAHGSFDQRLLFWPLEQNQYDTWILILRDTDCFVFLSQLVCHCTTLCCLSNRMYLTFVRHNMTHSISVFGIFSVLTAYASHLQHDSEDSIDAHKWIKQDSS